MTRGWIERAGMMQLALVVMLPACSESAGGGSEQVLGRRSQEDLPGWITGPAPAGDAAVTVELPEDWDLLAGDPGPSPPGGPLNQSWTRFEPPTAPLVLVEAAHNVEPPDQHLSDWTEVDFHGLDAYTQTERDAAPDAVVDRTRLLVLVGGWVLQFEMTGLDDVDYLMAVAERVTFDP